MTEEIFGTKLPAGESASRIVNDNEATGVLVCASEYAARCYRQKRLAVNDKSSMKIDILSIHSLSDFWYFLWDGVAISLSPINNLQALVIARDVVSSVLADENDSDAQMAIARRALHAYISIHENNIDFDSDAKWIDIPEHVFFKDFYRQFRGVLKKRGVVLECEMPRYLLNDLSRVERFLDERLVWLTPRCELKANSKEFLEALAECSGVIFMRDEQGCGEEVDFSALSSEQDELDAMVLWVKSMVGKEPACGSIAVLVDDIWQRRAAITDAFERGFPDVLNVFCSDSVYPWEFVGGEPYHNNSFMQEAIDWVRLSKGRASCSAVKRVVGRFSETLTEQSEYEMHSALFGFKDSEKEYSIELWLDRLSSDAALDPELSSMLVEASEISSMGSRLPSEWVNLFIQYLENRGWYENASAFDDGVVAVSSLEKVFLEVSRLDSATGSVSIDVCLGWLREVVDTIGVSVRSSRSAPIKILNMFEYEAGCADHVWVLGLTSSLTGLQRFDSSFISVERDTNDEGDQGKLSTLMKTVCAQRGVRKASFSLTSDVGSQAPNMLAEECFGTPRYSVVHGGVVVGNDQLFETPEVSLDPIELKTGELFKASASLVKDFCISPFLAFLKHRLRLEPYHEECFGISASLQGELLHDLLDVFWKRMKSNSQLNNVSEIDLPRVFDQYTARYFKNIFPVKLDEFSGFYQSLERRRLRSVCLDWIRYEKKRCDDFVVVESESSYEVIIGRMALKLRLDRVDKISCDGKEKTLIIDYKTGRVNGHDLNPQDLKEPQLPLYVIAKEQEGGSIVNGVALAKVSEDLQCFYTRADFCEGLDKPPKDVSMREGEWIQSVNLWRTRLIDVADGFLAGDISHNVNVKVPQHYGDFKSLMRFSESGVLHV